MKKRISVMGIGLHRILKEKGVEVLEELFHTIEYPQVVFSLSTRSVLTSVSTLQGLCPCDPAIKIIINTI